MKIAEKALADYGYQMVPIILTDEEWRTATDCFMAIVANG